MIAAPARLASVELLTFQPASLRGQEMFSAVTQTAPPGVTVRATTTYRGGSDLLMLWGPGHPSRFEPMRAQRAAGHTIAFDLAYWNRDRKIRCAVDAAHPQDWVMRRDWPASRFEADRPRLAEAWDPNGPVVIAGIGPKAKVQYGAAVIAGWEADMASQCGRRGKTVRYRRKQGLGTAPPGARLTSDGPIETVLTGASLLVTWHSNVAVDAIRLGIPVVCRDGAARAVCTPELPLRPDEWPRPLPIPLRDRFLRNLAWFQWGTTPDEARQYWTWLQALLAEDDPVCPPRRSDTHAAAH